MWAYLLKWWHLWKYRWRPRRWERSHRAQSGAFPLYFLRVVSCSFKVITGRRDYISNPMKTVIKREMKKKILEELKKFWSQTHPGPSHRRCAFLPPLAHTTSSTKNTHTKHIRVFECITVLKKLHHYFCHFSMSPLPHRRTRNTGNESRNKTHSATKSDINASTLSPQPLTLSAPFTPDQWNPHSSPREKAVLIIMTKQT